MVARKPSAAHGSSKTERKPRLQLRKRAAPQEGAAVATAPAKQRRRQSKGTAIAADEAAGAAADEDVAGVATRSASKSKAVKVVARPRPAGKRALTSTSGDPSAVATSARRQSGQKPIQLLNAGGSDQRRVLVLYTGGTMGMQDRGDGSLTVVPGMLFKRLSLVEELHEKRMPQCYFMEFRPLLDSADMCPSDWSTIATVIHDEYHKYDGFVVVHGTDTLAYTASALSFMLEQLAKPVILTGSMLPFFEPLSDARQNFLGSVVFAGLADISEVCVFFASQLFRGNRVTKANAASLQAFSSPCRPPLAELGAEISIYRRRLREPPRGRFRLHQINVTEILVVWMIPGFSDDFLDPLFQGKCIKGMVLLLYGCGTAPSRKRTFLKHLQRLVKAGVVIVACSQCLQGTVCLEKYSVGKAFQECGVISGRDMTTEAAVTKLSYLLSKGLTPEECRTAMGQDIRGEVSTEDPTWTIREPVYGYD